jgi:hypothetical protein
MQRMLGMRCRYELHPHQRIAHEPRRNLRADRQIHPPLDQRLVGAAEHRLVQLNAGIGSLLRKQLEAAQQQPGGKDDFHRKLEFAFPPGREGTAGTFERLGLLQ